MRGEVPQVQDVAEHAGDQEERQLLGVASTSFIGDEGGSGTSAFGAAPRRSRARAAVVPTRAAISAAQPAIVGASNSTEIGNSTPQAAS